MTPEVTRTDPEGIDYGWIMQVTFITSIVVGAPLVAVLSTGVELQTWPERARFAVGVGSVVWFVIAGSLYLYARRNQK